MGCGTWCGHGRVARSAVAFLSLSDVASAAHANLYRFEMSLSTQPAHTSLVWRTAREHDAFACTRVHKATYSVLIGARSGVAAGVTARELEHNVQRELPPSVHLTSSGVDDLGDLEEWELDERVQGAAFEPLLIRPLWLASLGESRVPAGALPLFLLDGDAFLLTRRGTLHASSRMLLALLVEQRAALRVHGLPPVRAVLDFGCGSGVLALAALRLFRGKEPACGYACDVSEPALLCTRRNAQLNRLEDHLEACPPWELPSGLRVELAMANMLAGPLISVAPEIAQRVSAGGCLLISGFRQADAPAVRRAFEPYFGVPARPASALEGWLSFVCTRNERAVSVQEQSAAAVEG
uniref:ETFB lysine methyltransferase n=1 Tax=Coccolithus braarudii TaxID=221442 RepID=A0A7S0Q421_9EUKA|mmetsp:Transcript_45617/g.97154  ORF Transcript_45617/g.97154 Transcript_45617/m.97154 type:complete len:352 (+) Transcript_45617:30-1085(+)